MINDTALKILKCAIDGISEQFADSNGSTNGKQWKEKVYEALATVTSALQSTEWTPVSKGLPAVGEDVLVTRQLHFWDQDRPLNNVTVLHYAGKIDEGFMFRTHNGDYLSDITAWMPKPEPYTESEEHSDGEQ